MASDKTSFQRIAIIGLGLIGGSWALALRKIHAGALRIGCDRPEVLDRALAAGAIDQGAEELGLAVEGADLVILATPVGALLKQLLQLKSFVSPRALVTDVGSTKQLICQRARDILGSEPLFLGGHPLAGKERSGFGQADEDLFKNARYALTPLSPESIEDGRVKAFVGLVERVGAKPLMIDAETHDRAVAFLSHLPQLLSSGLASMVADQLAADRLPLELAASGFRDVTRLAESPYDLWRDICLTNLENIQTALESLIEKLEVMKRGLSEPELEKEFRQALELRKRLRRADY